MKTDTIVHQLQINSLSDANALCTCGGWSLVHTGAATRKYVEEEFNRHIAAVFPSTRAKHTEGPWKVFSVNATIGTGILVDSKFGAVCRCHGKDEESRANARLIAAAPELLNAVKQWEVILFADCTDGKTLVAIRKLIAKVVGQ